MKLSDIMGHAGLSVYAEIALVLFMLVFLGVAVRLLLPNTPQAWRDAARMPLDDDPAFPTARHGGPRD